MVSIADYLRDFGTPGDVRAAPVARLRVLDRVAPEQPADIAAEVSPADFEAQLADAFRRGREAEAREAQEREAAALEAERARHREELDGLRTAYEQDYATSIATRFDRLADGLSASIGQQVGETLAPFIDSAVRGRVVDELVRAIRAALAEGEEAEVKVTGPAGLFEQLSLHFGASNVRFRFEESDEMDVTVDLDGTVFATRLSEWSEALKEAIA